MLFSGKTNGYFVEINEYSTLVARTSSQTAPLTIEKVEEVAGSALANVGTVFNQVAGPPRAGAYRNAVCGIAPDRRFLRRASPEAKRAKEANYLEELLTTQFRAEPDKMMLTILSASDGSDIDPGSVGGKEVLFCGGYTEDFSTAQKTLLEAGIFPDRLELTSVASLGGMRSLLSMQDNKSPTLVLEIGRETTHCYIVNAGGVDLARPIPYGINSMIPIAQKELGLRDEEAAAKLLFSNTFDFTGMGPNLVKRLLKELQSSIGFFEVQTGQSIGYLHCSVLPPSFTWLSGTLASALGVAALNLDLRQWAESQGLSFAQGLCGDGVPSSWFGLLCLMAKHQPTAAHNEAK